MGSIRDGVYSCPFSISYWPLIMSTVSSLNKIKEKGGSTTRKLIGHSGPVYSVAFDPTNGSASPPKYLLSSSADATARLWSLDTMTNVVAYRGHQNPVWDVKWSPMGIYFATASRDRTARLWSTDRTSALRIYAGHLSDVNVSVTVSQKRSDGTHASNSGRWLPPKFSVSWHGVQRLHR